MQYRHSEAEDTTSVQDRRLQTHVSGYGNSSPFQAAARRRASSPEVKMRQASVGENDADGAGLAATARARPTSWPRDQVF